MHVQLPSIVAGKVKTVVLDLGVKRMLIFFGFWSDKSIVVKKVLKLATQDRKI